MLKKLNFKNFPKNLKINLFDLKKEKEMINHENIFFNYINSIKIKNFLINLKLSPCCNSKKFKFIKSIKKMNYYLCNCRSIFLNPRPNNSFNKKIYSENGIYTKVRKIYFQNNKAIYLRKKIYEKKFKQVNFFFKKKKLNILDYGSGNDFFLELFNQRNNLYSIDINKTAYNKNINRIYSIYNYKKNFFDVITLWGVLEHLMNPYNVFKMLHKVIKKNGLLVIETPSSESILARKLFFDKEFFYPYRFLEPYRHLTFFSRFFFEIMCKKFHFKIIKIDSSGLDLQTILGRSNKKENINQQQIINNALLGDHYRVFLKKE